jgi:predicted acyltransferase
MPTVAERASAARSAVAAAAAPVTGRLMSLDVFRGLTMAAMVMVNNQREGSYRPLRHAAWDGITFTDMVFPFFLWIVGVALTLSTARRMELGEDRTQLLRHAVKRAAIIFGIGLLLNGFPTYNLSTLRIPGVLQRIALAYLAATVIFLYTELRGRILWTVGLLLGYFLLMHPGGYQPDSNLSDRLDRTLLPGHLYTPTRDPEGTISTLTAIATCMLGILAGHVLRARISIMARLMWLLGGGAAMILLGLALDPFQPINKNLWTDSYTLLTAGWASLVFGLTYWLCDVRRQESWWSRPFVILGMNAMAVYIFHGLLGRLFSMTGLRTSVFEAFARVLETPNAALAYSLVHVAASLLFAWFLYQRRWFLKF